MAKVNAKKLQNFLKKCNKSQIKRSALGLSLIVALSAIPKKSNANDKVSDKENANTEAPSSIDNSIDMSNTADFISNQQGLTREQRNSAINFLKDTDSGIYLVGRKGGWFIGIEKEKLSNKIYTEGSNLNPLGVAILRKVDPKALSILENSSKTRSALKNNKLYLDNPSSIEVHTSLVGKDANKKEFEKAFYGKLIDIVLAEQLYKRNNYKQAASTEENNGIVKEVYSSFGLKMHNNGSMEKVQDKLYKTEKVVEDVDNVLDGVHNTVKTFSGLFRKRGR